MPLKMVLQSGFHGLYITFLAGILKMSFGQNECPEILYVEDIELVGDQSGVLTFDGLECNVTIEERDNSDVFNDLHIALLIVAAVGFLLWLSTICIAFCVCCYKSKEKDHELGLKLVNGQPHCGPPSDQAPHPNKNAVKEQEDPYDKAPQLKEKQLHQPDTKPNDQLLVSRADQPETSRLDNSVKSQSSPEYLEPKPITNQTATPLNKNTANPPKSRSTSLTEDQSHQSGRGLCQPETGSSKGSVTSNDPSVDTNESAHFRGQLEKIFMTKVGNSAPDSPSNDRVNSNLNVPTRSDEEKKAERMISDELQYDAVE